MINDKDKRKCFRRFTIEYYKSDNKSFKLIEKFDDNL